MSFKGYMKNTHVVYALSQWGGGIILIFIGNAYENKNAPLRMCSSRNGK